jgi:hypothetical protein
LDPPDALELSLRLELPESPDPFEPPEPAPSDPLESLELLVESLDEDDEDPDSPDEAESPLVVAVSLLVEAVVELLFDERLSVL